MTIKRINITTPADHHAAWQRAAKKAGLSLSEWIAKRCSDGLPKRVAAKLSDRKPRGRPKADAN